MTEQAWYHLKRKVTELPFVVSTIENEASMATWEKLDLKKIGRWVGRIHLCLERRHNVKGDNNFHGWIL